MQDVNDGDAGAKSEKEAVVSTTTDSEKPRERVTGFSGDAYAGKSKVSWHPTPAPRSHYTACTGAAAARENLARNVEPNNGASVNGVAVQPGCCIFVGHLPSGMSEATVMQTMQMFGKVLAVKMFPSECYCLAQFTNPLDAQVAVNMMHKKIWMGETLNVKISHHPFVRL